MTVCIAARSNIGDFVVTLSDTMFASVERSVDSGRSKAEILNDQWICMYAAEEASSFREVYPSLKRKLATGPANVADVVAAVESAYTEARTHRAERRVLHDCLMTHEDFLTRGRSKLGDTVFERKLQDISELHMGLELLIAGLDDGPSEAHILSADAYGNCTLYDDVGFHAIGSGAFAALAWLHTNDDFRDARHVVPIVHRLLEAKYCAETSGYVGEKRFDIVAIVPAKDGCEVVASSFPISIGSEPIPIARKAWEQRRNQKPDQSVLKAIYDSISMFSASRYLMQPVVDRQQTEDPERSEP